MLALVYSSSQSVIWKTCSDIYKSERTLLT